jgi:hypothetical protein
MSDQRGINMRIMLRHASAFSPRILPHCSTALHLPSFHSCGGWVFLQLASTSLVTAQMSIIFGMYCHVSCFVKMTHQWQIARNVLWIMEISVRGSFGDNISTNASLVKFNIKAMHALQKWHDWRPADECPIHAVKDADFLRNSNIRQQCRLLLVWWCKNIMSDATYAAALENHCSSRIVSYPKDNSSNLPY